jgi:hypothetical protein
LWCGLHNKHISPLAHTIQNHEQYSQNQKKEKGIIINK